MLFATDFGCFVPLTVLVIQVQQELEALQTQLAVAEGRVREEAERARQAREEVGRLAEEVRMVAAAEVVTLVHATGEVLEVLEEMGRAERHCAQASFKAACTSSLRPHTLVA